MIYQGLSLAPHLTVRRTSLLGIEPARCGRSCGATDVRSRATDALARWVIRTSSPRRPSGDCAAAAQQIVEIARALAIGLPRARARRADQQPRAGRCAPAVRSGRAAEAQGQAIVYISHFLEEVKAVADRFVVLRDGRTSATA